MSVSLALCFLLYFLAENGKINAFGTYLLAVTVVPALFIKEIRARVPRNRLLALALLFLFYLALGSVWASGEEARGFGKHLGYAALIAAFMIAVPLLIDRYSSHTHKFAVMVVCAAMVSAVCSIYLHFLPPDQQSLPAPRLYAIGRLSNPVVSATSYGFAVVLGIYLGLSLTRPVTRIALVIAIGFLLWAIALSGSRAAWLAIAIAAAAGVALTRPRYRWWLAAGTILMFGVLAVALTGLDELTRRAFSFRPEIWSHFVHLTLETAPFAGVGSGTSSEWVAGIETFRHPHSIFISTLYFGGAFGLAMLIGVYLLAARSLFMNREPLRLPASMTLTFGLVVGLLDGDNLLTKIDYLWWIFWLPVALCISLNADGRRSA